MTVFEKISALILIAALAMCGSITLTRIDWGALNLAPYEDGETQAKLQDEFAQAYIFRDLSISLWRAFEYEVFAEGTRAVLVGRDGWLFSTEEFQVPHDHDAILKERITLTAKLVKQLEAQGISVVVALLPDKARVMREKVPVKRSEFLTSRYAKAQQSLVKLGVETPNLLPVFEAAEGNEELFFKSDTHWTPHGARAVAGALASNFQGPISSDFSFSRQSSESRQPIVGDLVKFVSTSPMRELIGPSDEMVSLTSAVSNQGISSLLGDAPNPEGRLVGTSFSAIETWGFLDELKLAYQRDFLNFAEMGNGPFEPMQKLIESLKNDPQPPRIVVWELPERYLSITPKGGE